MILQTALSWLNDGYSILPIAYRSKYPDKNKLKKSGYVNEKNNASWEILQTKQPALNDVGEWFSGGFRSNLGIICGFNNLVVVDFDNIAAYDLWRLVTPESIQATFTTKTARGMHLYYKMQEPPKFTLKLPMIDVKANGYVLAPPSIHPKGHEYKSVNNLPVLEVASIKSVLPESLLQYSAEKRAVAVENKKQAQSSPWDIRSQHGLNLGAAEKAKSVPITTLIQGRFIEKRKGWLMGHCPIHEDKRPSFWINVEANRCGCNACVNGSMSSIDLYMALNGVGHNQAIQELVRMI